MRFETSDTLPKYFRELGKKEILSKEQEQELGRRVAVGDQQALEQLIRKNLRLVVTLANRHIGQGVAIDDLIQEGNMGLYEAARRYDPESGTRFSVYASLWIRKYLNESVAKLGRLVRLPHNQEYDQYKAKRAGLETESKKSVSLDAPIGDQEDEFTLGDLLSAGMGSVERTFEIEDVQFRVKCALQKLKQRDREIIKAYFGLDRDCSVPTDVIAENFGMSNVRVCQIVKSSLKTMSL